MRQIGLLATVAVGLGFGASPGSVTAYVVPAPGARYQLHLEPLVTPPNQTVGLFLRVRVNGGPPLRLLLDSGAQCVVLDRKAAARSGCAGGTDLELVEAGARSPVTARRLRARTVELGALAFHDAPILVLDQSLGNGIQGALPLSLFAEFLIRLDIPSKTLELTPYPAEGTDTGEAVSALSTNHLLFLKGTYNETHDGYFLLDTGASYNAISRKVARQLNLSDGLAPLVPVRGGSTDLDAPLLNDLFRIRLGSHEITEKSLVVIDLSVSSRYHKVEISGLLGYPALRDSVLFVNYRDRLVRITPK